MDSHPQSFIRTRSFKNRFTVRIPLLFIESIFFDIRPSVLNAQLKKAWYPSTNWLASLNWNIPVDARRFKRTIFWTTMYNEIGVLSFINLMTVWRSQISNLFSLYHPRGLTSVHVNLFPISDYVLLIDESRDWNACLMLSCGMADLLSRQWAPITEWWMSSVV
jgi:hypothetical protein